MKHIPLLLFVGILVLLTACPNPTEPSAAGQLEVSVGTLDFKETAQATFTLKNSGRALLTWTVSNLETLKWVKSFSNWSGTIPAGQSVEITLTIERGKLQAGLNKDTLDLKNSSNENVKSLIISAFLPAKPTVALTAEDLSQKTSTGIRAKASITQLGSSSITQHGHVWGTSPEPTVENGTSSKLNTATTTGAFFTTLSGLKANTTYYIRAYAINEVGVGYSAALTFKTLKPAKPAVALTAADLSQKTSTSIRAKASITQLGSSSITQHGHVWGTSPEPTVENGTSSKLNTATTTGAFFTNLTGLKANTTYYIRAYAINEVGISYSAALTFKTLKADTLPKPTDKLTGFDPFYKDQWYLENTGQFGGKAGLDVNVKPVWTQGYLGTGIHVGILDAPVDHTHPDLKANLTADRVQDFAKQPCNGHGTNVTGVIAARDNGVGIQGIAPRATLHSYGVITSGFSEAATDALYKNIVKALESSEHTQIAVYNASLGSDERVYNPRRKDLTTAFETVLRTGFGGLGSVLVFSAGNAGQFGSSNNNLFLNHYATIGVNSVTKRGEIIDQTGGQQGANLWLLGPTSFGFLSDADKYITTDPVGACGVAGDYKQNFSSTSGAAPMVTGTIALVRQANPKLTWRDVKLILAESADKTPTDGQTYQVTGKMYSDPAKDQMYENRSGFGIVDATAAVNLAKTWTLLPAMKTFEAETTTAINTTTRNVFHTSPLTVTGSDLTYIESVTLIMTVEKAVADAALVRWDLHLVNPEGKEAIIYFSDPLGFRNTSQLREGVDSMHLSVNNFLGNKTINGRWQLKIRQSQANGISKIKSWKIVVRGH